MQALIDVYKNSGAFHHAYFFVGDKIDIPASQAGGTVLKLKKFLNEIVGIKTEGNPDVFHGKFSTLSIEDARSITEASQRKDFSGERKIFIIETDFITEEAQNSLLKSFEEPTAGTHFFIISPQDMLLSTLRSRMQVIVENPKAKKSESVLGLNLKERLEKVKEITDAISDEDATKQDAITFLNQIETELYKNGTENKSRELQLCSVTRDSLYDRGAPVKMILENLVLSI